MIERAKPTRQPAAGYGPGCYYWLCGERWGRYCWFFYLLSPFCIAFLAVQKQPKIDDLGRGIQNDKIKRNYYLVNTSNGNCIIDKFAVSFGPLFCSLGKWKAIFAHRTCLWYTHQILLLIRIHRRREIEWGRLLSCYWFGFDFGSSYQSQYRLTLFIFFFCTLTHARLSSQSSAIGEIYMRLTTQQNLHFIAIYYSLNATKWFYSFCDFILFFLVYWTSSFLHKFYNTIEKWCMCFSILNITLSLDPLCKHLKRFIYVWEWHYYKITFLFGAIFASTINNVLRMHSICDDMTLLSHYFDTNQHKINDANFRWFFFLFSRFLHVNLACEIHKWIRATYRLVNSHLYFVPSSPFIFIWFDTEFSFPNSFHSLSSAIIGSSSSRERYVNVKEQLTTMIYWK